MELTVDMGKNGVKSAKKFDLGMGSGAPFVAVRTGLKFTISENTKGIWNITSIR